MLAAHFRQFLDSDPDRLHFAAHSHHPWPDATRAAHLAYWDDSAGMADRKWDRILGEVVPAAQAHVRDRLHIPDARQVAFANNTHEFVNRLLSCLEGAGPFRVLASAHEFHSFRRQARRLVEAGRVVLDEVPAEPWDTFGERFAAAARGAKHDLAWLSHVFFDSGYVVPDLAAIVAAVPERAMVVIDGYHAFCALPVDISAIHERAFYLAGGYKYAMAGEGACFLAVPPGCRLRPVDTGWFASFDRLAGKPGEEVPYADDAFRFWGATFDPSGLYRFNAAMDWLDSTGTTIADVHRHAKAMQKHFVDGVRRAGLAPFAPERLVPPVEVARGNFLTFEVDGAEDLHRRIAAANIVIDRRDRRLRFGFGVYHDASTVEALVERLASTLR